MHGYKPILKWKLAVLHNCPTFQCRSMIAFFTFPLLSFLFPVMGSVSTFFTFNPFLLPVLFKRKATTRLVWVMFCEFYKLHKSFLKCFAKVLNIGKHTDKHIKLITKLELSKSSLRKVPAQGQGWIWNSKCLIVNLQYLIHFVFEIWVSQNNFSYKVMATAFKTVNF